MFQSQIDSSILSKEYHNHPVFEEIKHMMTLYDCISYGCFSFIPSGTFKPGTPYTGNFASYIYWALEGTLDSIQALLKKGRINDALVLVRKLFDDVLSEIYIHVTLKDKYDWENAFVVEDVDEWLNAKHKIPNINKILNSLKESQTTQKLYPFFGWETHLKKHRELLNDSVHSNRFQLLLLNCNRSHFGNREKHLQNISILLNQIITIHLAFIFYLNPIYLMASDYTAHMDAGLTPPDGSEAWIASYAQEAFDKYIKPHARLAAFIRQECNLQIA